MWDAVETITLRPGAVVWRHGTGHAFFPNGARLAGEIVRVNAQKRIAVIRSGTAHFTVNLEDLDPPPSQQQGTAQANA